MQDEVVTSGILLTFNQALPGAYIYDIGRELKELKLCNVIFFSTFIADNSYCNVATSILLIGPLRTPASEIWIKIQQIA